MSAVIGLDLSLTATGISTATRTDVLRSRRTGMDRLVDIRDIVLAYVDPGDMVFVEGYAMGTSRQSHSYAIGELGGVVRLALFERNVRVTDVPPATLKKFACDRGNAGKPDMLDASRRCGYEGSNDDNCVDGWWLRQFGLYVLGAPEVPATKYRDAVTAAYRPQEVA